MYVYVCLLCLCVCVYIYILGILPHIIYMHTYRWARRSHASIQYVFVSHDCVYDRGFTYYFTHFVGVFVARGIETESISRSFIHQFEHTATAPHSDRRLAYDIVHVQERVFIYF